MDVQSAMAENSAICFQDEGPEKSFWLVFFLRNESGGVPTARQARNVSKRLRGCLIISPSDVRLLKDSGASGMVRASLD